MIFPVILCGGSGTRLWPASRKGYPKQFAPLIGPESLFQQTLRRCSDERFAAPLVMTVEDFRFMAEEQATGMGLQDARIVIEPTGRDTAPAILSAALLLEDTPDAAMLVAPSDHVIGDISAFLQAVSVAAAVAGNGTLVTFGVPPIRPETGYGYLELGAPPNGSGALPLTAFIEKPDAVTAQAMLEAGNHLWNAGIFLFRVADVISAFETHSPDLIEPCRSAVANATQDLGFLRLDKDAYAQARAISFDYAIMEKAEKVAAVPLQCSWSDLGAWDAIWKAGNPDEKGMVTDGEVTAINCKDSYLRSDTGDIHLVGLGLDGVVAVAMRDAVLVASMDRAQDVKAVVSALRDAEVAQADDYPRFHRPWGWYETLCLGGRFRVKRIMVKPGGVLSLQSHHHRAEHWIVVEGTAKVTVGEEVKLVSENQSVYIPLGATHRMSNPGKLPMFLIEVQTGSYLGEDDIVRYEDAYDRT